MADSPVVPSDPVFITDGQFETAAKQLNAAADALTTSVSLFESYIKRHAVDIPCWVIVKGWDNANGEFWRRELGYDQFGGEWAIGIREVSGLEHDPDLNQIRSWAFSSAPRKARVSAAERLSALLHELTKEMLKTSRRLTETAATTAVTAETLGLVKPDIK